MNYEMIDMIYIMVFIVCIVILLFIIIRSKLRERQEISIIHKENLKKAAPQRADEKTVKEIKKSRWMIVFLTLFVIGCVANFVGTRVNRLFYQEITEASMAVIGKEIFIKILCIEGAIWLIGIACIVAWVIYDIHKIKAVDDKVLIPAYVQSAFTNPKHKVKTVQLVFYDYKSEKFRFKRTKVNRFEDEKETLFEQDMVTVVAMENKNNVKFVGLVDKVH